jgi:hypothetical protein
VFEALVVFDGISSASLGLVLGCALAADQLGDLIRGGRAFLEQRDHELRQTLAT